MAMIMFLCLFLFFLLGVPIAFALGAASLFSLIYNGGTPLITLPQRIFVAMDSFPLMAVPLFLLAGTLMEVGGVSERIVTFVKALVGHIRGSLAYINVLVSMLFAGISGAAVADTAAVGSVMLPAMKKEGYNMRFAVPLQGAAGSIGVIIPPSIPMIIFAVTAGTVSISSLFLAGIIPGILIGLSLLVLSYFFAGNKESVHQRFSWKEALIRTKDGLIALFMPLIILGGILSGIFTPTESAVIAVMYAIIVGGFIYKELTIKQIPEIVTKTALTTGAVMLIIGTAALYGWILTSEQIPRTVSEFLFTLSDNKWVILLMINVILLIIGTFLETIAAILVIVPIVYPIATAIGIDPVHFGIILIVNLAIGMITPPVGITLLVSSSIGKIPIASTFKYTFIIIIGMLLVLLFINVFPNLVLYVPNLFQ